MTMTKLQARIAAVGAIMILVAAMSARGSAQAKVDVPEVGVQRRDLAGAGQPTFTFQDGG